jgi:putative PIN family toxin of toxin-antitoxin system
VRRVVLDTNIYISGVILRRGSSYAILEAWRGGQFQLLTSSAQRAELDETLHRPKFTTRYELIPPDIAALLAEIDLRAELIASSSLNFTVRDPDDTPILASAVAGNAEFLVTGDNDLLVLAEDPRISPLRIVTPSDFLARLP